MYYSALFDTTVVNSHKKIIDEQPTEFQSDKTEINRLCTSSCVAVSYFIWKVLFIRVTASLVEEGRQI